MRLSHLRTPVIVGLFVIASFTKAEGKKVVAGAGEWTHKVNLEEDYGIKFQWRNTPANEQGERWLFMEFSVKMTGGYVGVGFSPKGSMDAADMLIAWQDSNGKPHSMDFHGVGNGPPIEDISQDYTLLSFETTAEGWTNIAFKRLWDTCDPNDMVLTNDTMRLIWAYGDSQPSLSSTGKFQGLYHGHMNRGARSVILADGGAFPPFPDDNPELYPGVKQFDMKMDRVRVEPKNTSYYCKLFKFEDTEKKTHVIGWKPLIQHENRNIVHHILTFECSVPQSHVPIFDHHFANHPGGACYTPNMPPEWGQYCVGISFTWVVGSEGEMFPDHVGGPLGEMHGGSTYFMLEMHYENPVANHLASDSSGIRLFYTEKLRKYDGGTLLLGYRHSPFLLIPPHQDNFVVHGLCGSECTSKMIPEGGIHLTNTMVHLHLTGRKIRLRHFRSGVELPLIAEDNHYDFNYQQSRSLQKELTILPGDELVTECEYETRERDRYVVGGLATDQEMCQVFIFYYPRLQLAQCTSQYEFHDFFKGFHVEGVEGEVLKPLNMPFEPHLLSPEDQEKDLADDAKELEAMQEGISYKSVFDFMNITAPARLKGKSVGSWLDEMKWSDQRKGKELEEFWRQGKQYQFCSKPGLKRVVLDSHIINYPKVNQVRRKEESSSCKNHVKHFLASASSQNAGSPTTLLGLLTIGIVLAMAAFPPFY